MDHVFPAYAAARLAAAGRFAELETLCRRARRCWPNNPDCWQFLGTAALGAGNPAFAVRRMQRAVALSRDAPHMLESLGAALVAAGRPVVAMDAFRRALLQLPGDAALLFRLGQAALAAGDWQAAVEALEVFAGKQGDQEDARNALAFAHAKMGMTLVAAWRLTDGITAYRRSLELVWHPAVLSNLAIAYGLCGDLSTCQALLNEAVALNPNLEAAHSSALLALNYQSNDPVAVALAHRNWRPAASSYVRRASRKSGKPRIGYVSPDFRGHSVASFIEPVLQTHDREQWDIVLYYNAATQDRVTRRIRRLGHVWRPISHLSDEAAIELIRQDQIDILVDLAGHTGGGRLSLFSAGAAPMQVTYLGYPNTTGIQSVDYRITDSLADPPGLTERFHTERLVRIDPCFLCYKPPSVAPPVSPLPSRENGIVTFGCFNHLPKISAETLTLWSAILKRCPTARLLLKCRSFADAQVVESFVHRLRAADINPAQAKVAAPTASYIDHLAAYGEVDIGLDPFPYHGTTTTCEGLWMGVPVISLQGPAHVSRVGGSLMNAVGLPQFAVESDAAYVETAVFWAANPDALFSLRKGLRRRMAASALLDSVAFTRRLERLFHDLLEESRNPRSFVQQRT